MFRVLLLSLVGLAAVSCSGKLPRKIMHELNQYNLREKCFGRKNMVAFALSMHHAAEHCMQLAPLHNMEAMMTQPPRTRPWMQSGSPFQTLPAAVPQRNPWASMPASQQTSDSKLLSELAKLLVPALRQQMRRNKRQAGGLIETDESDLQEFLEDFADFKEGMHTKISNLTCVLTQLNMLDANLQPNMPYFTDSWDMLDTSEPNLAFYDPEWKMKMINGYKDCHAIAESWPQESLDRNKLTKVYGRHMIFFHCTKKVQVTNCAKFMIKEWLEAWYGKHDEGDPTQYGFPADKYDAAALSLMVLNDAATPEEEFVNDFFWGEDEM